MVPHLALVDWVALVIAAVLLAAVVAALVVAWIAARHKGGVERVGTRSGGGRTVVRRSTPERPNVLDMKPGDATSPIDGSVGRPPVPESRPRSLLDAPPSATAPVLAKRCCRSWVRVATAGLLRGSDRPPRAAVLGRIPLDRVRQGTGSALHRPALTCRSR